MNALEIVVLALAAAVLIVALFFLIALLHLIFYKDVRTGKRWFFGKRADS